MSISYVSLLVLPHLKALVVTFVDLPLPSPFFPPVFLSPQPPSPPASPISASLPSASLPPSLLLSLRPPPSLPLPSLPHPFLSCFTIHHLRLKVIPSINESVLNFFAWPLIASMLYVVKFLSDYCVFPIQPFVIQIKNDNWQCPIILELSGFKC